MKRSSIVVLTVAACLGHAAVAPAQMPQVPCAIGSILQPTYVNVGPTVYTAAVTYPDVANAIVAAVNGWNATEAANRILYSGVTRTSDCPDGRPTQVGAFNFITTNCATTNGQGGVVRKLRSGLRERPKSEYDVCLHPSRPDLPAGSGLRL